MASDSISHDPSLIAGCRHPVLKDWIDYNGHMNVGYYAVVFDRATDVFLDAVGLGQNYVSETGGSTFTAEIHINFIREVHLDSPLYFTTQLIGFDDKRIHYFHHMYEEEKGFLAATNECLSLHVELARRKVVPIPPAALERLEALMARQAHLPPPEQLGHVMATKRRAHRR